MKQFILIVSLFIIPAVFVSAQTEICLKKGWRKARLNAGDEIQFTLKGDSMPEMKWKNVCFTCDSAEASHIWTIDKIDSLGFDVKQIKSYRYDTLTWEQVKKNKKRSHNLDRTYSIYDSLNAVWISYYVYKYPDEYYHERISYDSLSSISFAKAQDCGWESTIPIPALLTGIGAVYSVHYATNGSHNTENVVEGAIIAVVSGIATWYEWNGYRVHTYELSEWKISAN